MALHIKIRLNFLDWFLPAVVFIHLEMVPGTLVTRPVGSRVALYWVITHLVFGSEDTWIV